MALFFLRIGDNIGGVLLGVFFAVIIFIVAVISVVFFQVAIFDVALFTGDDLFVVILLVFFSGFHEGSMGRGWHI